MAAKKQNKLTRRAGNHFWQVKNLADNEAELILYKRRSYSNRIC